MQSHVYRVYANTMPGVHRPHDQDTLHNNTFPSYKRGVNLVSHFRQIFLHVYSRINVHWLFTQYIRGHFIPNHYTAIQYSQGWRCINTPDGLRTIHNIAWNRRYILCAVMQYTYLKVPMHLTVKGICQTKSVLLDTSNEAEAADPTESMDHLLCLVSLRPVLRLVRGVISDVTLSWLVEEWRMRTFLKASNSASSLSIRDVKVVMVLWERVNTQSLIKTTSSQNKTFSHYKLLHKLRCLKKHLPSYSN